MRRKSLGLWPFAAIVFWGLYSFGRTREESERNPFESKVRPILEARCQPCHFSGGKMYERLPFDRPETIRRLGSRRLFTRLHDEKDRAVIREFLGETKE